MTVLKWLLIIFGVVFIAAVAAIIGGYYWASTVESVKLTAADLDVGGAYPPEERQTLIDACQKGAKPATPEHTTACTCIADKAGTQLSRFERLALAAGMEGSPTKIVALTKGLIDGGISQEKVESMQAGSKPRIDGLLKACGLEAK
jgi:hypothetical protein